MTALPQQRSRSELCSGNNVIRLIIPPPRGLVRPLQGGEPPGIDLPHHMGVLPQGGGRVQAGALLPLDTVQGLGVGSGLPFPPPGGDGLRGGPQHPAGGGVVDGAGCGGLHDGLEGFRPGALPLLLPLLDGANRLRGAVLLWRALRGQPTEGPPGLGGLIC